MVLSLPFPPEVPDPGSGPGGGAAKKVEHIFLCNTSMWKKNPVTLTNPLFWKMITEGKRRQPLEESYSLSVAHFADKSGDSSSVVL